MSKVLDNLVDRIESARALRDKNAKHLPVSSNLRRKDGSMMTIAEYTAKRNIERPKERQRERVAAILWDDDKEDWL